MLGNGISVDVFKLYLVVREKGGYHKVTQKGLWGSVAEECGYRAMFGPALKLITAKHLSALDAAFQRISESKGLDFSEGCLASIFPDNIAGRTMDLASMERFFSAAISQNKNVGGGHVKLGSRISELDLGNELRFSGINEQSEDVKLNGEMNGGNASSFRKAVFQKRGISNDNTGGLLSADTNGLLKFRKKTMGGGNNGENVGQNVQNLLHRAGIKSADADGKASKNAASEIDVITISDEEPDSLAASIASDLKRKRDCPSEIIDWITMVAKNPCDPAIGTLPEISKWKSYTSSHIWKQILMAREAMMLNKNVDSNQQKLNWQKKQRMNPMMYDTISERQRHRHSQRILSAKECPKKKPILKSSSSEIDTDSEIDYLNPSTDPDSILKLPRQSRVPTGRNYQAQVDDWIENAPYEPDLKWAGTRIWPSGNPTSLIEREPMGRGRHGSCGCSVPGSIECVKFHVNEKRTRLRLELGTAYYQWGFNSMGEDAAISWLKNEETTFNDTVKKNPFYLGEFWAEVRKMLPTRGRKSLVCYYFNVFNLRRRADQNRSTPAEINSDDDEPNDGSEMVDAQPGSIFCSPKKKSKAKSK